MSYLTLKKNAFIANSKNYPQLVNYTMLYDAGDEISALTGDWVQYYRDAGATITKNAGNIYLYGAYVAAFKKGFSVIGTTNTVDLTNYTKINAVFKATSNSVSGGASWAISSCGTKSITGPAWQPVTDVAYPAPTATLLYGLKADDEIPLTNVLRSGTISLGSTYIGLSNLGGDGSGRNGSSTWESVFVTKTDDWEALRDHCGLASGTYTTEDSLIASTPLGVILGDEDFVKYMIANCTGSFLVKFVISATALGLYASSAYKSIIDANTHWAKFLAII